MIKELTNEVLDKINNPLAAYKVGEDEWIFLGEIEKHELRGHVYGRNVLYSYAGWFIWFDSTLNTFLSLDRDVIPYRGISFEFAYEHSKYLTLTEIFEVYLL